MKVSQKMKRRIALLMSAILTLQSLLTGSAAVTGQERAENIDTYDIKNKTEGAYDHLTIRFGEKVEENSLFLEVDASLENSYLEDGYYNFLDNHDGLDPDEWESDKQGYGSYDAYLDGQDSEKLPEIWFSVRFNLDVGTLDIGMMMSGDMITKADEVIGQYQLTKNSDGSATLKGRMRPMIYYRQDVGFGQNIYASLEGVYGPDAGVTVKPGMGDHDFTVTVPEEGLTDPSGGNYKIDKKSEVNQDNLSITYTISAASVAPRFFAASGSEATGSEATDSEATGSETDKTEKSRKKKKQKKLRIASDSQADTGNFEEDDHDKGLDPEDDANWEEDEDSIFHGPGLFDFLDRFIPDVRMASSNNARMADLAGLKITDKIPEGLTVARVEARINATTDGDYVTLEKGTGYTEEDGTLSYMIPADPDVHSADLRITTRLSDELYNQYMVAGKAATWHFTNKAALRGPDDGLLAMSPSVSDVLELGAPFSKDKKTVDATNREFEWRLKVTSKFSNSGVTLYAVDHIMDVENTHDYRFGSSIIINGPPYDTEDGEIHPTPVLKDITWIEGYQNGALYAYDELSNIGRIQEFIEEHKTDIKDPVKPIVYKYVSENENGSSTYDAVMLIPLSNYKNQDVTIDYKTTASAGLDGLNQPYVKELKNEAKILWKWPSGHGPGLGGEEFGGADIEKTYPVDYSLVKKKSAGYDEATNRITWNFEINQFGAAVGGADGTPEDYLRIEDELTDAQQKLVDPDSTGHAPLKLIPYDEDGKPDNGNTKDLLYSDTDSKTGNYYTIEKGGSGEKDTTKLIVHFTSLEAAQHYLLSIVTEVTDENLGSSGTQVKISNNAKVTGKIGDTKIDFSTGDECGVKNTLIRKETVPFETNVLYNYSDNTVKWKITINPRGWKITNPAIVDTLPEGTHFAALTDASYAQEALILTLDGEAEWTEEAPPVGSWRVTNSDGVTVTVKQDNRTAPLTFTFSRDDSKPVIIDKPFEFEFTNYVEKKRRLGFNSNAKDTLSNKAVFTGRLSDSTTEFHAHDIADNAFDPAPMKKDGRYTTTKEMTINGSTSTVSAVDWILYINRTKTDMTDTTVTDEIQDCMELIPETMRVSKVTLDVAGKEVGTPVSVTVNEGDFDPLAYNRFVYKIPAELKNETLKFEFTTVMVDEAYAADINNSVSITGDGFEDETNKEQADDAKNFHLADYAHAKGPYYAKIDKTSTNQDGRFPLQGAEFEIYEAEHTNGDVTDAAAWTEKGDAFKTRVSNKRGGANFMFLKENTMYIMKETKSPPGYILDPGFKWYVVLKPTEPNNFPSATSETAEGRDYDVYVSETGKNSCSITIENKPKTVVGEGDVSFTKKGHNGQLLEGVLFTMTRRGLVTRTENSGEDGIVTFKGVDPIGKGNYYTIRESNPTGYKPMTATFQAEAYLDENGKVVTNMKDADTVVPGGVITNEPIIQSGSFKKLDQNGGALAGVEFKVERRGDGGQQLGSSIIEATQKPVFIDVDDKSFSGDNSRFVDYLPTPSLTSDDKGVVNVPDFLYGDYKLTEITPPEGIQPNEDPAIVYLKVDNDGMFASDALITTGNPGTKLTKTDGTAHSVRNAMQYGMIQVNKVVGEKDTNGNLEAEKNAGANIPIDGIKFKIFKDVDGDKNFEEEDKKQEVMELATNKQGNFTIDNATGEYTLANKTKKRLLVGTYFLEEQKSDWYEPAKKVFPFEIEKQNGDDFDPKTIYVDSENNKIDGTKANLFLNEPLRGKLTLIKEDQDYPDTKLTGAEFKVYTKEKNAQGGDYVANLVEDTPDSGQYVLKEADTGDPTCADRDDLGRLYLKGSDADKDGRSILYGTYRLEEVTAPENYEKPVIGPDPGIEVKVDKPTVNKLKSGGNITNEIIKKPVHIKKLVEQRSVDPNDSSKTIFDRYSETDGAGFLFTLGTDAAHSGPVNMPSGTPFTALTAKTGQTGAATFNGVPIGTYVLTETAVPKKYGAINGDAPVNSYIEPMKPISVTVTKDGVSYKYADAVNNSNEIATAPPADTERGTEDISGTGEDLLLTVRNNYKLGSATGIKMAVAPGISTVTATALQDAEFTLTSQETNLKMTVASDSGGRISFTAVPFGTYRLEETGTPPGYKPVTKEIIIASDTVDLGNAANHIDNELILSSLKFAKVDQNGDALAVTKAKTEFEISSTHSGFPWPTGYTPPGDAVNDKDGLVSINNLAYGIYTVTEKTVGADSDLEGETISFVIEVGPGSIAGKTKITITPPTGAEVTDAITLEEPNSDGIYDFTETFKLKNRLKHGDVRIQKTLAEKEADGTITDTGTRLAGIEFEIYRKSGNAPEDAPFATLVTDGKTGDFKKDNGKYVNKDGDVQPELIVGDYYLKEIFPLDSLYEQFSSEQEMIEFTVADSTPPPYIVTEFTYDGTTVVAKPVETADEQGVFYNLPVRKKLSVEKKDRDTAWNQALKGAEFTVSLDKEGAEEAALLTDENSDGVYDLSDLLSGEPLKKGEVPYLHGGLLLPGTYYIKETKAPLGYILSSDQMEEVVIGGEDVLMVEITNKPDQVAVQFLKVDQNGNPVGSGADDKTKVIFNVERLNSSESETELDRRAKALLGNNPSVFSDAFGIVKVENLITGAYKLTEQNLDWASGEAVLYITVAQSAIDNHTPAVTISNEQNLDTATVKKTITGQDRTSDGVPDYDFTKEPNLYQVENELCYALVNVTKVAAAGNADGTLKPLQAPLSGVRFNIYEDLDGDGQFDEAAESTVYLELVTDREGRFKMNSQNQYRKDDASGTPQLKRMVYGRKYMIREEKLPDNLAEHYQPDPSYYPISIDASAVTDGTAITYYLGSNKADRITAPDDIELTQGDIGKDHRFPNGPLMRGEVKLGKSDAENPDKAVTGAEFAIYAIQKNGPALKAGELTDEDKATGKNTGTYSLKIGTGYRLENPAGQLWMKEDENQILKLLAGRYYIKETKAPGGYVLPKDTPNDYWYFKIGGDGDTILNKDLYDGADAEKAFTNSVWKREVVVQKQVENLIKGEFHDAGESDDTFTFELAGIPDNGRVWETQTVTVGGEAEDRKDKAVFKDVPSGKYTLTEIMTGPSDRGGRLSDVYKTNRPISVIVDERGVRYDGSTVTATQILVKNELKRGSIEGKKITEDLTGEVALAGAAFSLIATEPDTGDTRTVESDSDGRIFFPDVPLGRYELKEIKAPDHYEISDTVLTVTVSQEGQTVKTFDDGSGAQTAIKFMNHGAGSLTIEKQAEVIEDGNINGVMRPGHDFVFRITGTGVGGSRIENVVTDADITGAKQIVIRKDGSEGDGIYVTTGPDGTVILNGVPVGEYQVREQENEKNGATGEYVRDVRAKSANISIDHKDGTITQPVVRVENRLKRVQIKGLKTQDDKTTPLAGAVIGLFPSGTVEFTEAKLWCGQKMTTEADGVITFTNIPYGTYLIAELAAPAGYYLNSTTKIEVIVSSEGVVTTGYLIEGDQPKAEQKAPIMITNTKRSTGGGGGGGGGGGMPPVDPNNPGTGPGAPTQSETEPTEPGTPILPDVPTIPVVPAPGGGNIVEIPPEIPPGSDIVVTNPNGDTVYEGTTGEDGNLQVDLPPGDYLLTSIDENGVPLAQMVFTIEDEVPPLAMLAPDAGDHSLPIALLAAVMLGALIGIIILLRHRKENSGADGSKEKEG